MSISAIFGVDTIITPTEGTVQHGPEQIMLNRVSPNIHPYLTDLLTGKGKHPRLHALVKLSDHAN